MQGSGGATPQKLYRSFILKTPKFIHNARFEHKEFLTIEKVVYIWSRGVVGAIP